MTFLVVVVGVACLLLALRAVGVLMLSPEELAKLQAISCPVCRKNLQTVMAICGLFSGLKKLEMKVANRLGSLFVHQSANKRPRPPVL